MCARLLACPLCSQPGFLTLDALRTGLVSVATRPLACPVCNEVLLGIDKLTIHLFGHTINANNSNITQNVNQSNVQLLHNVQAIPVQTWNILKTQNMQLSEIQEKNSFDRHEQESSYILKDNEIIINSHISRDDANHDPKQGQVIFLQNITSDQIYPTNCDFSKVQENLIQKAEEKQITNLESNDNILMQNSMDNVRMLQNNDLILRNSDLNSSNTNSIQNNSNAIQNNANLLQNDGSLSQSNSNLLQNNVNLIQDDSGVIQNNSNLIQADSSLIQSNSNVINDSNLIHSNSNLIQSNSNVIQNGTNLIQNGSNLIQDNSNLIQSNSNAIHDSNLIQSNSNVIQNDSNLIQSNSNVIQNDSNLIQNNSNIIQNNSNIIQNSLSGNNLNLLQNNVNLIQGNSNLSHENSNFIQGNSNANQSLIHQNEKTLNLQVGTIQNSWIQNNSSIIIVKDKNLEEISENDKNSYQEKSNGMSIVNNENESKNRELENELKSHEEENEIEEKDPIHPYLKALRLLAAKDKERCNVCGYRCDDRKILILHKQLVHLIDEKDLNVRPEDLLKNYPCHLCTKVFKMRGSLMVHMRVAHTNYSLGTVTTDSELNNENGYNCPICGKNFKKEQHVTQHLRTHDGKQWECDVCCKMFTTKYFLKKHKRLHSGEMPYKCNICDKTFTFQQSYHKHRLYHKDDKPHTCNTCGRSFKELSTLHNHERIHTGEKPFACETCGKCFRQRVSYLVHRRIHTGVMPYKCTTCGKSFRYKVSQRTHKCQTPAQAEALARSSEILFQRLLQISEARDKANESLEIQAQNDETKCSERNKFILLMNEEGEPILTRQSDLDNAREKNSNVESQNSEKGEKMWSQERNNTNYKETTTVSAKDHVNTEELQLEVPQDIFSMMLLPGDKDVPTPSAEMEHLRLSSPIQKENVNKTVDNFSDNHNRLEIMGVNNENIQERFDDNHIVTSLRTIDDTSLSELIYGIDQEQ